ncbi:MAG TPA: carboxypeptidase regulatory-like domain-containing protein, partial [Longimicrobium sp.]
MLAALLMGAGWSTAATAQAVTTAAIAGRVANAEGQPVAGAQVSATNTQTGSVSRVVTRADGRYLLPGLQPGQYRIVVSALGLGTQTRENVQLTLGETSSLNFDLAVQAITLETLTVTGEGSGVISQSRTGPSAVVSDSTLRRAPTITRDLQDFTRLVPQIAVTNTETGAVSGGGRNNRFNQLQIDGSASNDLFGLSASGSPSGQAGAKAITLEAIQELQVVLAPFDVRQNGFTGAAVNAITRSGTNEFHGSIAGFNRNEELAGEFVDFEGERSGPLAEFENTELAGSFGGPIVRDRAFFFLAGERTRRVDPLNFVAGTDPTRGITTTQAQQVADYLATLGYDPGGIDDLTREQESTNLFGRLDFNLGQNNRLTVRHNYITGDRDSFSRSASSYTLGNAGYVQNSTTHSSVLQLNSSFGGGLFNELRLGYNRVRDHRSFGGSEFPRITVQYGSRSVVAGTENFSGRNVLDQDAFEITNDLTIPFGAHTFTVGTSNEFSKFSNLFVRNPFGNYTFDSFADLQAGRPEFFEYSYLCQTGLPNCTGNGSPRAEFGVNRFSLYGQDRWDVRDNLQLTLGVRVDAAQLPDTPEENPDVVEFYDRSTADVPGTTFLFNPRFGFNWDVQGDQTTQVRGGAGLFSGRTPYVWISNAYGNTGLDYVRFTCSGTNSSTTDDPPPFVADPFGQPMSCVGGGGSVAPNEINLIDPNFKSPQVARFALGVDRQLPFGFIGTLEGLYTKTIHDVLYQNLRVSVDTQGRMVEGRPRYQTRSGSTTPGIGDVIDVTNTDEGFAYNLTAQVQRPFRDGWDFSLAYTYSHAEDVNPVTSSQAISNWRFNLTQDDPNNPGLSTSDFDIPHRVVASTTYRVRLLPRAATDLSLVYIGQSGQPYSYRYFDDINFDGSFGNDLLYVPASQDDIRF